MEKDGKGAVMHGDQPLVYQEHFDDTDKIGH